MENYQTFVYEKLSPYQEHLFRRATEGFSAFTPDYLKVMHPKKKEKVKYLFSKTQKILNLWKQQLCNNTLLALFGKSIPNLRMTAQTDMLLLPVQDEDFSSSVRFSDFGIGKKDIINKLMEKGVLPKNFYELTKQAA
jgi:hypothetical protein